MIARLIRVGAASALTQGNSPFGFQEGLDPTDRYM